MHNRKFGRDSGHRKAMLRNLTTDLIVHERITTTEAKAKDLRSVVEKMITLGKRGDLHARRQAAAYVRNVVASTEEKDDEIVVESALQKLFSDLPNRYAERNGGYTRIYKTVSRRGDGAPMVVIELV
ncbi:50S ribosomal protein L17 [Xylocopilactobacillus apicola]|uniref:Large ribosomal subunit protein bL17 n=1 Tax=Xylocopilactobacillus apicola TaxID=2932184 RepID=A0AAU9D6N5_9LACO|nr:50S ribosomal protein L17 [Xylocopilactobacillus apicola]BDR59514.1 50S ribosomal protein L17 [Xylocopilactobacillus apicola]